MTKWIEGSIPGDKKAFYWLTLDEASNDPHCLPAKWNTEECVWVDAEGLKISSQRVIAYCRIEKPKQYSYIGIGFFIKTTYSDGKDIIYGLGLQPANWTRQGYNTVEKAKMAVKRLKKIDDREGTRRTEYAVINERNIIMWKM